MGFFTDTASASAARRARWPARSGTRPGRRVRPARHVVRQHRRARREHLAARRVHRAAARSTPMRGRPPGRPARTELPAIERARRSASAMPAFSPPGERSPAPRPRHGLPLADDVRRLQALHARRLPGRVPDRLAVPHRVRHRRRAGGHLQRLRLLRPGLPVRRHRPAQGRRPGVEVHAVLRPARRRADAGVREGLPDRVDPVRRARRAARAGARRGWRRCTRRAWRRAAVRRTTRTTASAATARSSCCSTSRRCTACRRTRW